MQNGFHLLIICIICISVCIWDFPGGSVVKNLPANAGDVNSIPGLGRSPGEGNGNPLQYSCLENPMDRGAWWATVQGSQRVRHDLATKQQQHVCIYMYINIYMHTYICIHQVTNPLGYKVLLRQLVKCFLNPVDTLTHAPSSTVVSYKIQNPIPVVAFET